MDAPPGMMHGETVTIKPNPETGAWERVRYTQNDSGPFIWTVLALVVTYFLFRGGATKAKAHVEEDPTKRMRSVQAMQATVSQGTSSAAPAEVLRPFVTGDAAAVQVGWTMIVGEEGVALAGRRVEVVGVEGDIVDVVALPADDADEVSVDGARVTLARKSLRKAKGRLRVLYRVHGVEYQAEAQADPSLAEPPLEEMHLEPFGTVLELRMRIAHRAGLKPYQFHLIYNGDVVPRTCDSALAAVYGNRHLRVFVVEKTLREGYRPPPPADPALTEAMYASMSRRLMAEAEAAEQAAAAGALPSEALVSGEAPGLPTGTARGLSDYVRTHPKVVVFFFLPACPPCRAMKTFFERLADTFAGRLRFFRIDGTLPDSRAALARHDVTSYPTFISFLDGKLYQRCSGADESAVIALADSLAAAATERKSHNPRERTSYDTQGGHGAVVH